MKQWIQNKKMHGINGRKPFCMLSMNNTIVYHHKSERFVSITQFLPGDHRYMKKCLAQANGSDGV